VSVGGGVCSSAEEVSVGGGGVSVAVGVGVLVAVGFGVLVAVGFGVFVAVGFGVFVGGGVGVFVGGGVGVSVGVDVAVRDAVGVTVRVDVGVAVRVRVGVAVRVPVGVAVRVDVDVGEPEGVSVLVGVAVSTPVGVGVPVEPDGTLSVWVGASGKSGFCAPGLGVTADKGVTVPVPLSVLLVAVNITSAKESPGALSATAVPVCLYGCSKFKRKLSFVASWKEARRILAEFTDSILAMTIAGESTPRTLGIMISSKMAAMSAAARIFRFPKLYGVKTYRGDLTGSFAGVGDSLGWKDRLALAINRLRNSHVDFLYSQVRVEAPIAQTASRASQNLLSHLGWPHARKPAITSMLPNSMKPINPTSTRTDR
jgi:hypothetical protein